MDHREVLRPVRFWEIDAAIASMLMLLAAVDERPSGSGTTRPRRPLADQVHRNGW